MTHSPKATIVGNGFTLPVHLVARAQVLLLALTLGLGGCAFDTETPGSEPGLAKGASVLLRPGQGTPITDCDFEYCIYEFEVLGATELDGVQVVTNSPELMDSLERLFHYYPEDFHKLAPLQATPFHLENSALRAWDDVRRGPQEAMLYVSADSPLSDEPLELLSHRIFYPGFHKEIELVEVQLGNEPPTLLQGEAVGDEEGSTLYRVGVRDPLDFVEPLVTVRLAGADRTMTAYFVCDSDGDFTQVASEDDRTADDQRFEFQPNCAGPSSHGEVFIEVNGASSYSLEVELGEK